MFKISSRISLMIALLQTSCWLCEWKNSENRAKIWRRVCRLVFDSRCTVHLGITLNKTDSWLTRMVQLPATAAIEYVAACCITRTRTITKTKTKTKTRTKIMTRIHSEPRPETFRPVCCYGWNLGDSFIQGQGAFVLKNRCSSSLGDGDWETDKNKMP